MLWIGFVLVVAAMVAVAAPWVLARYLGRLPYAPECPHCHTVTGQRPARGALERAYEALTASTVRSCARCGWAGRMRWRLAPERVGGRR
jgi:drug/metabolite transporter (DMT)-like permease